MFGQMVDDVGSYPRYRADDKQTHWDTIVYILQQSKEVMRSNDPQTSLSISNCPFFVRFVYLGLISTYLLNWMTDGWIFGNFALDLSLAVKPYQVHRILTGWLCEPSFLTLFLVLLNGWTFMTHFQFKNSSVVILNDFMINNFALSALFFSLELSLWFFNWKITWTYSVVSIWMNLLFKYCYYNPDSQLKLCFINRKLRMKYYPFYMFILICLVNLTVRFDALLSLTLAIIECAKFNGGFILFTKDTYIKKQKLFTTLGVARLDCWQNLDINKIEENNRMTVSSSQFYLGLQSYCGKQQVPIDDLIQHSIGEFQGSAVPIG